MEEIHIEILGKNYKLKQNFRALLLYEEMTGQNAFKAGDNIKNHLQMFYCLLKGANRDSFTYEFDEFVDVLDEHQEIFPNFEKYLQKVNGQGTNSQAAKKKRK